MLDNELKFRVISDLIIHFHAQLPLEQFEKPIPQGIKGIQFLDGSRGRKVDILDQEIALYSRSLPGDPVNRRLVATMSVIDAQLITTKLASLLERKHDTYGLLIPQTEGYFNPDDYPYARILCQPGINFTEVDLDKAERPFPSGSINLYYPFMITSLSPISGRRIPSMVLTKKDAEKFIVQTKDLLSMKHYRGRSAIVVEEAYNPNRVLIF